MEYFIPGYIYLTVFQILTSRKTSTYQVVWSVIVSYILKAMCSIGHKYIMVERPFSWDERVIILLAIAITLSVITVIITEFKPINRMLLNINHKSIHDDIWQDVIDYKKGTTLRIVCDDVVYIGVLLIHEEKGNESWFVLDDYIIEENNKEYRAEDNEYPTKLAIKINDVKRVEMFYPKEQKKDILIKKVFDRILKKLKIKKDNQEEAE